MQPAEQVPQPLVARVRMKAIVPVLRDLEVRNLDRQLEYVHGYQPGACECEPVRNDDEMVGIGDHRGDPDSVRQANGHAPMDAGSPEGLVNETFLRCVSATGRLIDQVRSMQELLECQRIVYIRMVLAHHADVLLLEEHLAVDGAIEVLEVPDRQIDVTRLKPNAAHACRWHLHGLDVDFGSLGSEGGQYPRQQGHLPGIVHEDP